MDELEALWPDPDRRDDALARLLGRVHTASERTSLLPAEQRVLQALSVGLDEEGAAHVLGLSPYTVKDQVKKARRALRAKNVTHACCEALRQGLIR